MQCNYVATCCHCCAAVVVLCRCGCFFFASCFLHVRAPAHQLYIRPFGCNCMLQALRDACERLVHRGGLVYITQTFQLKALRGMALAKPLIRCVAVACAVAWRDCRHACMPVPVYSLPPPSCLVVSQFNFFFVRRFISHASQLRNDDRFWSAHLRDGPRPHSPGGRGGHAGALRGVH